ncbi:MAG TPA: transposase [Phycisphaerae bacterium]|nr:transposase [Phycisphaerae bacterium]HNU45968.1 transposase [Phycisphaerae bacterium]
MYRLRGTAFQAVGSGDIDQAAHRQDACATGGTAFQAVGLHANQPGAHGQDARATYELVPYNPREVSVRYSAYLPHWEQEGATYAVTFRLADSLPREVLEGWLRERQAIVRRAEAAGRCLTATEQRRLRELHSERVEKYLDTGRGACALKDERAARIVRDALLHFDGERYDVIVWCVMPNHVHVVVRPRPGHELSSILHSWKSFTSNEVNKVLGLQSALWQPDSFDHLIRDTEDLERSVQYVLDNPGAAGLSNWPWAGCGTAFQAVGSGDINQTAHRQDACATGGTAFQAVTQGEDQWGTHGQDARATGGTAFQAVGLHADQPGAHGQDARATNPARGFVYKTVPHITLKSIAQNVALDPIFAKHEPILDKALGGCNNALAKVTDAVRVRLCMKLAAKAAEEGVRAVSDADARRWLLPGTTPKMLRDALEDAFSRVKRNLTAGQRRSLEERIPSIEPSPQPSPSKGEGEGPSPRPSPVEGEGGWQQWQVPFDTDDDWPAALRDAVTAYRESWRAKMDEVNACIAASAEQEELVDDPKRVPGITRVTGPFTVEAVQPPEMALGDNIDPYTRGTGFQPVVQPVEDHGLDHGQNHGQDACPGFQPVENHGQDAHATQEGLFDGAPEELPDGFEPRTLRMVEPTNELEVANVTAYLDQMFRYLKADGVRFLNNRQMRWIRFEPLFESGRAGIFHAEGRWLAVANGKGPLPQPSPLKGEGEEGGPNNVAVVFGPQYGPVTAAVVEEAIRQSLRAGYEHLLIAGFSFDGAATGILSEGVEPGVFQGPGRKRVHVHFAHVRPDINPGMNGLLKESPQPGAGQLFSVFGLPRVRVEKRGTAFQRVGETGGHGQDAHATRGTAFQAVRTGEDQSGAHGQDARATDEYVVEMQGVDIYNPVDNSITSTGASKVAAWFLDSDYDGRTFCITQAFFPDRSAWDKLARALNGKDGPIDADRFEAFSGTKSLPFPAGKHRCVAVKVIDPRGNEVMCVRRLDSRS